tara:strand:- start:1891 stop:2241 length:351 start_codon:yes stop_codon:yes gene_type:complete
MIMPSKEEWEEFNRSRKRLNDLQEEVKQKERQDIKRNIAILKNPTKETMNWSLIIKKVRGMSEVNEVLAELILKCDELGYDAVAEKIQLILLTTIEGEFNALDAFKKWKKQKEDKK